MMKESMRKLLIVAALVVPAFAQTDLTAGAIWTSPQPQNLATVPADGNPGGFPTALRATTAALVAGQPWTPQLSLTLPVATRAGQWLRFRFWARSANGSLIGLIHELNAPPDTKALDTTVKLPADWKEFAYLSVTRLGSPSFGPSRSARPQHRRRRNCRTSSRGLGLGGATATHHRPRRVRRPDSKRRLA